MPKSRIIVAGGGAAGLMAAGQAAAYGAEVLLIEKMNKLGSKILISGKGRCNLTNAGDISAFVDYYPGNGRFLYSALKEFSNEKLLDFFHRYGVKTKVERGGRVFPEADDAEVILRALQKFLAETGVKVILGKKVTGLILEGQKVSGVQVASRNGKNFSGEERIEGDAVIIATGGASFPGTGSDGDGYVLARKVGHRVITPLPALVPLRTLEQWPKEVQGLTLKNVEASIWVENVRKGKEFGEMLFTHFGISGPIILTLSRIASHALYEKKKVQVKINLKPALRPEQLDLRLARDFSKFSNKQFKNSLNELLPKSLIPVVIGLSGISPEKAVNQLTKEERKTIRRLLQELTLNISGTLGMEVAIVTSGGIDVKEINPVTMESRLIKGLFWAGEVIDVDGITGGYNLQAAFSTGFKAGKAAAVGNGNAGGGSQSS